MDGKTLPAKLIQHVQGSECPSIISSMMHEVVGPHVVHVFCLQPDARPIIEPQTAFLGLLWRDLQPLTLPQAFDPLVIDLPARVTQQRCQAEHLPAPAALKSRCPQNQGKTI